MGLLTLPLSNAASAQAQESDKSSRWVTLGLGATGMTQLSEFSSARFFAGTISYSFGRRFFHQVRADLLTSIDNDGINSLNYAVGRGSRGRYHLAALFAGLGVVNLRTDTGIIEFRSRTTFGLIANAQAIVYPVHGIGFGISVYANVNPDTSVGAVYLVVVMGGNRRLP